MVLSSLQVFMAIQNNFRVSSSELGSHDKLRSNSKKKKKKSKAIPVAGRGGL
jgi:hypothetical protein